MGGAARGNSDGEVVQNVRGAGGQQTRRIIERRSSYIGFDLSGMNRVFLGTNCGVLVSSNITRYVRIYLAV